MKKEREPVQMKVSDISDLRGELLKEQRGKCPICLQRISDPVLDHSHKRKIKGTGLIRGVLCRNCNSFLGKIENNATRYRISHELLPKVLSLISGYLRKEHLPFIHPSERAKPKLLTKRSYNSLKKVYVGKVVFPEYKDKMKMTVKLAGLFSKYNIEPEFYK